METDFNRSSHYFNSRNGEYRQEIVDYPHHSSKWFRWWFFYKVANNPYYNPTLPTAS